VRHKILDLSTELIRSDEELPFYGDQFTLSTQLMNRKVFLNIYFKRPINRGI